MPYGKALKAGWKYVELSDAAGCVAAVNAGFFPPAYPVVTRGEIITAEIAAVLSGGGVYGTENGRIKVVEKPIPDAPA
jgi:arginine/lysine/ornithine decarboxylase